MNRKLTAIGIAWLLVMFLVDIQRAWAQAETFAKQGTYLGLLASPGTTIKGGSFDGDHLLYDAEQLMLIPRLNSDDGLGFVIGGRFESGAVEISYVQAEHQATFADLRGTATSRVLNIDGKYFFFSRTRIQPYLLGGFAIPWLVFKDASVSINDQSGDTTLLGVGFNLGAGLAVYVHPRVALTGGYNYRLAVFPRVRGVTGSFMDIDDKSEPVGRNGNLTTSVTFTF